MKKPHQSDLFCTDVDAKIASDALAAMHDEALSAIATWHRDKCCEAMWNAEDSLTAAMQREKCLAWEKLRCAYDAKHQRAIEADALIC